MPPEPARPIRIVLYVDASHHWHTTAEILGDFARKVPSHVTVTASLLLPAKRARAMQRAQELLALPPENVQLLGRPGILEYTIPDVARRARADVVVIGKLGNVDRITSGRVAHLVAKRTPASILVSRGHPRVIRRILVCTEGQRHGLDVFEKAALIARTFHAQLDVLHVVSQMGLTHHARAEIEEDLRDFLHSDAPEAEHLRDLDERLRRDALQGHVLVRAGLVVDEILDATRETHTDLLVIGAHDIGAPGGHLYEDFASQILRASPISTLVVRHSAPRPVNGTT